MIDPGQPAVSATHRGRVAPVPRRRRRAAVDPGRESVLARAGAVCASAGVITLGHARGGDRLQCGPRGLLDDALHCCSRRASHPAVDAPRLVNSLLARRRHPPLDGGEQRRSREHRSQILPEFAFSVPVSRRCLRIQYTPRMSGVHSGSIHQEELSEGGHQDQSCSYEQQSRLFADHEQSADKQPHRDCSSPRQIGVQVGQAAIPPQRHEVLADPRRGNEGEDNCVLADDLGVKHRDAAGAGRPRPERIASTSGGNCGHLPRSPTRARGNRQPLRAGENQFSSAVRSIPAAAGQSRGWVAALAAVTTDRRLGCPICQSGAFALRGRRSRL